MSLWKILGIVAGAALAGAAVYAGVKITKSYIKKMVEEEIRRQNIKNALTMKIKKVLNDGEHSKVDVGIYNELGRAVGFTSVNGNSIASDIHEGMVIPLTV